MTTRIAAVVPVIDEREAIAGVVGGLRVAGACCVFVVDGRSSDDTPLVARRAGAVVIDEPRRGYGRACLSGVEHGLATQPDGHVHDALAFLDGDGSCDPSDLPPLVEALREADVVLGRRPGRMVERGAMPWHALLGNQLVAGLVSIGSGRRVHDLPPFKVLRHEALERLALDDEGYGWTVQLVARALGDPTLRVIERPVAFRVRDGGVSKVSGSLRASAAAARAMVRQAVQESRPRPLLALMAKAPGAGHAKTRLAAELGEALTAELWRACLTDATETLREVARRSRSTPAIMLPRAADVRSIERVTGPGLLQLVQRRPGLPAALSGVFRAAFEAGSDRAIAIAADAPSLEPEDILAAGRALEAGGPGTAVLGPSHDGGYNLIGLRWAASHRWWPATVRRRASERFERRLEVAFRGAISGRDALEATTRGLAAARWRVRRVAASADLDTLADVRLLAQSTQGDGRRARTTVAWIEGHRDVIDDPPKKRPAGRDKPAVGSVSTRTTATGGGT